MDVQQLMPRRKILLKSLFISAILSVFLLFHLAVERYAAATEPEPTLHEFHVDEMEISCTDCHDRDVSIQQETCEACHEDIEFDQLLAAFREDLVQGRSVSYPQKVVFTHEKHPESVACTDCHNNYKTLGRTPRRDNLSMQSCFDCHDKKDGPQECKTCHGIDPVAPPQDHALDFRRAHGAIAQVDRIRCDLCHGDQFCQDCHEGQNLQGNIHPLNWEHTHSMAALGQEDDCLVCHHTRQECVDCHRVNMVLIHPLGPGWANSATGGDHRSEAEGNLESCLDCHDLGSADPVCTRPGCHN